MPGLPPALLRTLKNTLLDCGPFGSHRALVSVFADERLAPWKNQVSEADSKSERVDLFVSDFLDRKNRAGQSVLVLFLQALHDQTEEQDECHQRLDDLAILVAAALNAGLPPLARRNLLRAEAVRTDAALPATLGGYGLPPAAPEPGTPAAPLPPGLSAGAFAERLESLKHKAKADWLPVSFLEKALRAAGAVGRVERLGAAFGTAFLVAPGLVLTNAHVMRALPEREKSGVRFNVGLQPEPQWRYFAEVAAQSPVEALDFALVRLRAPAPAAPVTLSVEAARAGQPANILQHPYGDAMQVALRHNEVVRVDAERLYYVADTEGGSSGSPVFDDDWHVIGLHRAGLAEEGRPVKNANEGVPITAIAPLIQSHLAGG